MLAATLALGFLAGETGPALAALSRQVGLSPVQEGLVVSIRFVGSFVASLLVWFFSRAPRIRALVAAALALIAASSLLLPAGTYSAALLVAGFRGISLGVLVTMMGVFVSDRTQGRPAVTAAALNASVSVGLVLPATLGIFLAGHMSTPWQAYWVPSAVAATVAFFLVAGTQFDRSPDQQSYPVTVAGRRTLWSVLPRTQWGLAATVFLIVGTEAILLGLLPAVGSRLNNGSAAAEGLAFSFMGAIFVGRFAGLLWVRLIRLSGLLVLLAILITPAVIAWGAAGQSGMYVLTAGLGLLSAPLYPAIVGFISEGPAARRRATSAAAGWAGGLGGAAIPAIAGLSLDNGVPGSLLGAFVAVPLGLAAILVVREARRRRAQHSTSL